MRGIHRMRAAGSACRTNRSAIRRNEKATASRDQGNSAISFWNSDCGQARAVRVRTFPCELSASAYFATLSPLGVSTMTRKIVVAGGEMNFDLDSQLLGELAGRLRPLGSVLD